MSIPIPSTPRVISPSPTPSETSDISDGYFTRSAARKARSKSSQPTIHEDSGSDSSLEKRARTRSRSPILSPRLTGLTQRRPSYSQKANGTAKPNGKNGNALPAQTNGHLSPYTYSERIKKSWRDFSRSPSPLGLIPLHRHYRTLIHKHEIPRKALHVSIGFLTLNFYRLGLQTNQITPWLVGLLLPIASVDILRHRSPEFNRIYVRYLGALMRETEVDGYNGVIWYLLGAIIALQYPTDVAVVSILLLSWCDTAASTFGRLYGRYTIRLRRGKSLAGTMAACLTGVVAAVFFWGWMGPRVGEDGFMWRGRLSLPSQLGQGEISGGSALAVLGVVTGLIASFSEFVDLFGWDDNLTIPLISSAALWVFLKVFG